MTAIEVGGDRFACEEWGDARAPVALLLHGFPDHPPTWQGVGERLAAAGYRVVAPWMRGYHPSVLDGPYDADQLARDVIGIAAVVSPGGPVHVIGHDWGAIATYRALALAPQRFRSAVALSVPHPHVMARNALRHPLELRRLWYMALFQMGRTAEWSVARNDMALIDRLWTIWSPGFALADPARRALHACLARSMPAPIRYYRALPGAFGGGRARIETPLLYLHGDRDGCARPLLARGQDRLMAGPYQAETLPGVGHFLQAEDPSGIARRVERWLSRF